MKKKVARLVMVVMFLIGLLWKFDSIVVYAEGTIQEGGIYFKDDAYDKFTQMIKDGKMAKYCRVKKDNGLIGSYTIKVTYCPAYVGQIIANLAGPVDGYATEDWIGVDLKGKYFDAILQFALASGKISVKGVGPGGMDCPHMPGTYYLVSRNTDYGEYNIVNQAVN